MKRHWIAPWLWVVFVLCMMPIIFFANPKIGNAADTAGQSADNDSQQEEFILKDTEQKPLIDDQLYVGAGRSNISPTRSLIMGGYGIYVGSLKKCRWSKGVHDPLYATAIIFKKGSDALVMIELDLVGFVSSDVKDVRRAIAKRLTIDFDHIIVASTHTHHSPDTYGLWGTLIPPNSGRDEGYMKYVKSKALEAAIIANESLRPAKLFYAVGEERELHYNIYESKIADAPIDHTLTFIKATDPSGKTIATITNWSCHGTTEDEKNLLISADWVGYFYQAMESESEGVHMYINGSIGASIQPSVPWRDKHLGNEGQGFVWAKALGTLIAEKACALGSHAAEMPVDRIEAHSKPVTVNMTNLAFQIARTLNVIHMELPSLWNPYTTSVTAAKMGRILIGSMPGEMSPQMGMLIRQTLDGKAQILVGLGQDSLGYMIDENQYGNSIYAYEKLLCTNPLLAKRVVDVHRSMGLNKTKQ